MKNQLTLLNTDNTEWRLDEETREVGRRGVAEARAALQAGHRTPVDDRGARPTAA